MISFFNNKQNKSIIYYVLLVCAFILLCINLALKFFDNDCQSNEYSVRFLIPGIP